MELLDVTRVTRVSSDINEKCVHCDEVVGGRNFTSSINHYIQAHGYKLIHVGSETSSEERDVVRMSTVAILGLRV